MNWYYTPWRSLSVEHTTPWRSELKKRSHEEQVCIWQNRKKSLPIDFSLLCYQRIAR
jgi:hypothetical protein